jgi:PPIC-type PPIASE domain
LSISVFQEKIIKGGCGKFVLFFCGAAMVFGMAFSSCNKAGRLTATDIKGEKLKTFATVGGVELPVSMAEEYIDAQKKNSQFAQLPPDVLEGFPPDYQMQPIAGGVTQAIQIAEVYEIAKKMGYNSDDDNSVRKALHFENEAEFIANILDRGKKAGQLKENATVKDLEELAKPELQGRTLKDVFTEQQTQLNSTLKDPQKRISVVLSGGQQFMLDKLSAGINPTDDEVKKGFENYEVKRVFVKVPGAVDDAAAKVKIDKAYAELKANKSFEQVVDAYSDDTNPDPKKKKSENVMKLSEDMIEKYPDFKTVLKLQPGTYSEPEKIADGYAILKFIQKKIDVPKDFEAKKAQYKGQNISQQIQKKFKAELDKIEKEIKPVFEIKAYEAAYRYQKAMALPAGAAQEAELRAIHDLAKGITQADVRPEIAAMLQVMTIQHIYDQPGADKAKLKGERISALENYLTYTNNWSYRKDVIDSYKEKGDKTKAFDQVMIALEKNTKFDGQAQTTFSDISAKFLEIQKAGLVSADQETQYRAKQKQWQDDKAKYDKEAADLKKQQEEDAKKSAEEAKKAKGSSSLTPPPSKAPGK